MSEQEKTIRYCVTVIVAGCVLVAATIGGCTAYQIKTFNDGNYSMQTVQGNAMPQWVKQTK